MRLGYTGWLSSTHKSIKEIATTSLRDIASDRRTTRKLYAV